MTVVVPDETILGLLAVRPQHGYELLDAFRDTSRLGAVWDLSTSQLYAVLKRLEQQGLTTGRAVQSADAPTRIEYKLTEAGEKRLQAWLHETSPSSSVRRIRVEFLSRLFVAIQLGIEVAPLLSRQREMCQQRRQALSEQSQLIHSGFGALAFDLQIAQLDTILQWLDRCQVTLQRNQPITPFT